MNLQNFILVACIFAACVKPPKHVQCSDLVTKNFIKEVGLTSGFSALGSGGFYSKTTVDQLYIDLQIEKTLNKEGAKELLLSTVDEYLKYINESEELKGYLSTYPMTPNQISLSIAFVDKNHRPERGISQVYLFEGKIYYSTYNKDAEDYALIASEPYSQIIQAKES